MIDESLLSPEDLDEPDDDDTGASPPLQKVPLKRLEFHCRKDNGDYERLDRFLTVRMSERSRADVQRLIEAGAVTVNDLPAKANRKIRPSDIVVVEIRDAPDATLTPENIPLDFLYEDEFMVVVNKRADMIVHPGRGKDNWHGTLANAIQYHVDSLSSVAGACRPGIVHRLDRDTSGVIVIAKDDYAHRNLSAQFEQRKVEKEYWALVYGVPDRDADYIDRKIARHPSVREKMAVREHAPDAREAKTFYEVLERFSEHALIRCMPHTGRTHQIRVHLDSIGFPIVADRMYSGRSALTRGEIMPQDDHATDVLIARQALHARRLKIRHPRIHEWMEFEAPLPDDFQSALDALRGAPTPK
jgi:23S rRNA pseudouridine1911/1915/1917 synthase